MILAVPTAIVPPTTMERRESLQSDLGVIMPVNIWLILQDGEEWANVTDFVEAILR